MKSNFISYQDTVTHATNDTLDILSVDTLKKVEETINSESTFDTLDIDESEKNNILLIPKVESAKKTVEKKNTAIEQKIISIDLQSERNNNIDESVENQFNFLKNIVGNNSTIKPESVFLNQTEQNQATSIKNIRHEQNLITNDWILPIFFISLAIMIWVRNFYYRQVALLFSSINNYQMSMKLFKDPSSNYRHLSLILNTNAALTVGLFLYQLANYYDAKFIEGIPLIKYLIIVLFLLVIYAIQFIGYSILGRILDSKKEYYEFLHHTYALIKVLGIIFIPFALIITYASDIVLPYFLLFGFILIIFFYFKRIQRGIKILMQKQFLKLHQILYFCSLEILPVMVILKYVNSLIERSF